MNETILLYLRTARNLKPVQLAYYPLRRVQKRAYHVLPAYTAWRYRAPSRFAVSSRRGLTEAALSIAESLHLDDAGALEQLVAGRLSVMGQTEDIEKIAWEEYHKPALWAYHLHYFDQAVPLALSARRGNREAFEALKKWVLDWVHRCRPGRGPGWEPYPVSQRLVNWMWIDLLLSDSVEDAELFHVLRTSAVQQGDYLAANVEYHLLANHLLKNAKALYLTGLVWAGASRAQRWFDLGRAILREQIAEQILADGGHFERSPMYHAVILQDLVEINVLSVAAGLPEVASRLVLRSMADFHASMRQPDGTRARFNDTAEGLVPDASRVEDLYRAFDANWSLPQRQVVQFPESGYYGYRDPACGETFLIDAGKPGPDYQPAHAHCDLLSFELYTNGRPWIIDPGVHGYTDDPYRSYVRSTRAHNTIAISGRDQSEIWGAFRMARQARVVDAHSGIRRRGEWRIVASYTPYFDGRILHERQVERQAAGEWLVTDRVTGSSNPVLEGSLHFHPSVDVAVVSSHLICRRDNDQLLIGGLNLGPWRLTRGKYSPVSGWFFPAFGVAEVCTSVSYELRGSEGGFWLRIVPG